MATSVRTTLAVVRFDLTTLAVVQYFFKAMAGDWNKITSTRGVYSSHQNMADFSWEKFQEEFFFRMQSFTFTGLTDRQNRAWKRMMEYLQPSQLSPISSKQR